MRILVLILSSSFLGYCVWIGQAALASGLERSEKVILQAETRRAATSLSINPIGKASLASLEQTRLRPIFSPQRRPIGADLPSDRSAELKPFVLIGAIAAGANSIAILEEPTSKAIIRLKIGESALGLQLVAVQGRTARIARSNGQELFLQVQQAPSN